MFEISIRVCLSSSFLFENCTSIIFASSFPFSRLRCESTRLRIERKRDTTSKSITAFQMNVATSSAQRFFFIFYFSLLSSYEHWAPYIWMYVWLYVNSYLDFWHRTWLTSNIIILKDSFTRFSNAYHSIEFWMCKQMKGYLKNQIKTELYRKKDGKYVERWNTRLSSRLVITLPLNVWITSS